MKKSGAKLIYFPSVCIVLFFMIQEILKKNYRPVFILIFLLIIGTVGFIKILKQSQMRKTDENTNTPQSKH